MVEMRKDRISHRALSPATCGNFFPLGLQRHVIRISGEGAPLLEVSILLMYIVHSL